MVSNKRNSLLEMVCDNPEKFKDIGFVFVTEPVPPEDAERLREEYKNEYSEEEMSSAEIAKKLKLWSPLLAGEKQ